MEKPVFYLGNFKIEENISSDVEKAAKLCKRDIRFLDSPIVYEMAEKSKLEDYKSDNKYGCIAVFDGKANCAPFWKELEKLRSN